MLFHYVATNKDGRMIEGDEDFKDNSSALEFLKNQGLSPISLKAVKSTKNKLSNSLFGSPISIADKIFLTKYLGLMLRVGTDIFKAIDILIVDFNKPAIRALLTEIRGNLEKGKPFYETFLKYPRMFSPVFTNLIRAGEASGNLEKIFNDLSISLESERALRQRIKAALIYPVLLICASVGIMIMLVTFAIPRISAMFMDSEMKVPLITRIIFGLSDFLAAHGIIVFGSLFVLIIALIIFFKLTKSGRAMFGRLIYKIPLISKILKKIAYQRFATTAGALMKAGLPIIDNLEITATTVGQEEMRQAILRIAHDGIVRGVTMGDAFRREEVFPQTIRTLIAIGEKAGHTEEILLNLAEFYESEIDSSVKSLVAMFEPLMLLFIGVIVGGIALAVIMPVYQFVGQMGA